jgi:hypothetical protein
VIEATNNPAKMNFTKSWYNSEFQYIVFYRVYFDPSSSSRKTLITC